MTTPTAAHTPAPAPTFTKFAQPMDATDLDLAFGNTDKLLPAWGDIPDVFKRGNTPWNNLVSTWFVSGLKGYEFKAKDGIDLRKALRHVGACLRSFQPKHEHKEAGCAYLLSLWLESATQAKGQA